MNGLRLLLVLLVAVICADFVRATGNKLCPDGCGFGAFCSKQAKKCDCRSKREGNPDFLCYTPKHYFACQIFADPMIKTTDKQEAGIKMPASLALTDLTTRRFGAGRGTCELTLDAWTKRFEGKYFIQGLQLKFIEKKKNENPMEHKLRIISKVVNNQYAWTVLKWKNNHWEIFLEIPPNTRRFVEKLVGNCKVRFTKLHSNFLFINVMCCVFSFAIRPHNEAKPHVIPGVYLLARNWAQLNALPEGLCNNGTDSPQIDVLKESYGFKSRTQYTTFQGLANGRPLDYPHAYAHLGDLQDTLTNCDNATAGSFMKKAEFLFNFEKIIACMKEKMMMVTHQVVKGFCLNDVQACDAAKKSLEDAIKDDCPEVKPNKQMKRFLKNGCV